MKILAVADYFPWPTTKGGLLRLATSIDALTRLGEVDLFTLYDVSGPERVVPPGVRLARLGTTPYPAVGPSRRWQLEWLVRRGLPLHIAMRNADPGPRRDFRAFAARHYDVVWFSTASTWVWLGRPDRGPTIVDLVDLEDVKERQQADLIRSRPTRGFPALVQRTLAEAKSRVNASDWSRVQHTVARRVDRVVLCSTEDVDRLGVANAEVVPNTFAEPSQPAGREAPDSPPTVLFQGTFDYAPNADAARWLATEIAPLLRDRLPGATVRLAGRSTPEVDELGRDGSEVIVVGLVPDMADELARADVVLVPLRLGSGTRLKVLEAFAHRVPVVSTTIGAEGLDVEDGVHLLIADTPTAMVDACARLQEDPQLRLAVVDAAQARFRQRYATSMARDRIREIVDSVARVERHPA